MFGQQYDEQEMKELMLKLIKMPITRLTSMVATLMVRKMHWSNRRAA